MSARCFISYKAEDSLYRDIILALDIGAFIRPPGSGTQCYDEGLAPESARDEILGSSTVTIFLIGKHSAESLGADEQKYIKRELEASLCKGADGYPNGVVGVVLPESAASVYKGTYICPDCGKSHDKTVIDDTTVIREFSENYTPYSCRMIHGRCVLVRWGDFIAEPGRYIEEAFIRRFI